MKLDEYIKLLEDLKSKYGNVDVKVNKTYEWNGLSINDTFKEPELPYYDKKKKSVIVFSEFYEYR